MKKLFVALMAVTMISFCMNAQEECSTMWPYLYPEFTEGTIYMRGGEKFIQNVNIHTLKGRLHYIDNGVVKEAQTKDLLVVEIGPDKFMAVEGNVMKVMASEERGFVAALILGDFNRLNDTGGAYGTSTTNSATQKLSSLQIAGHINQNHMEMMENRHNGEIVPLEYKYYIVTSGKVYEATRKAIEEALPERKAELKTWLKSNKIKWNNPESLLTLVSFLSE